MTNFFEKFQQQMRPYHNDIGLLYDTDLVRLLGVAEDALDLYYIVKPLGYDKESYWATAVGHFTSLKEINYPRYDYLEDYFIRNLNPPISEFKIEQGSDLRNWKMYKIKTVKGIIDEPFMEKYYKLRNELEDHLGELNYE